MCGLGRRAQAGAADRQRARVGALLDERAQRAHGVQRRVRVGRLEVARDGDGLVAHRAEQRRAVRERLVRQAPAACRAAGPKDRSVRCHRARLPIRGRGRARSACSADRRPPRIAPGRRCRASRRRDRGPCRRCRSSHARARARSPRRCPGGSGRAPAARGPRRRRGRTPAAARRSSRAASFHSVMPSSSPAASCVADGLQPRDHVVDRGHQRVARWRGRSRPRPRSWRPRRGSRRGTTGRSPAAARPPPRAPARPARPARWPARAGDARRWP